MTNSTWTLATPSGTTLQLAPRSTINQPVSGAFELTLNEIDLGAPTRENYSRPLAVGDGEFVRGDWFGTRALSLQLGLRARAQAVSTGGMEGLRDDAVSYVLGLLAQNGVYTLTRTRKSYANATVARQIRGRPDAGPPWLWSPRGYGAVLVGQYSGDHAVIPLAMICHQPFFRSVSPVSDESNTLDGTLRSDTFTNAGDRRCGVRIVISGTSGTGDITILNATGGGDPITVGSGIVLSDIDISAGSVVVDWFATDPTTRSATQDGDSILGQLSTGAGLWLQPGPNTLSWQVTDGALSGATVSFYHYELWGAP